MRSERRRSTCTRSSGGAWSTGSSRRRGRSAPDPLVVVTSPDDGRRRSTDVDGRRAGAPARHRRRRALARGERWRRRRRRSSSSRATRRSSRRELLAGARSTTHRRERAAATVLSFEPDDARSVRAHRARRRTVTLARDRRGGGRDARRSSRCARSTPRSTSSAPTALWPALDRLDAAQRAGRALPHRLGPPARRVGRSASAVHVGADPAETEGVNTPGRARRGGRRRFATGSTASTCSRASRSSTRGSTWIEPTVSSSPTPSIHPFTVLRGATRVAAGAEVGPHAVVVDATSESGRSSARSVTFAPARCSRRARRPARSSRSRTRDIGERHEGASSLVPRRR